MLPDGGSGYLQFYPYIQFRHEKALFLQVWIEFPFALALECDTLLPVMAFLPVN